MQNAAISITRKRSLQSINIILNDRLDIGRIDKMLIYRTIVFSSWNPSRKLSSSSSALSILSAYSPTIHIILARASGSSNVSRFSHSVAITDSYLFGYFLKMSCKLKQKWENQKSENVESFLNSRSWRGQTYVPTCEVTRVQPRGR